MERIEREENGSKGRFVLYVEDTYAGEMTYSRGGDDFIIIDHTQVEEDFGGKGYAKKLVMEGVAFARENNLKILPLCPYAKSVFDRDESLNDVKF